MKKIIKWQPSTSKLINENTPLLMEPQPKWKDNEFLQWLEKEKNDYEKLMSQDEKITFCDDIIKIISTCFWPLSDCCDSTLKEPQM